MSEPLAASLERLRNARLEPEPEAPSVVAPALPSQSLASRRLRRLESAGNPPSFRTSAANTDAEHPLVSAEVSAENLGWSAAAQGRIANLDDEPRGKPRLALGVRAALAGVFALLALGGGIMSAHLLTAQGQPITISRHDASDDDAAATSEVVGEGLAANESLESIGTVIVHVAGAVNSPGIVELPTGSRVAQAVEQAGGAAAEAELTAINLARVLVDGEQIVIPIAGSQVVVPSESVVPPLPQVDLSRSRDDSGRINLNQASPELLQELSGVGPALAGRIIDYREKMGGFNSVDQLQEVSGIGPAVMAKVRDQVTV